MGSCARPPDLPVDLVRALESPTSWRTPIEATRCRRSAPSDSRRGPRAHGADQPTIAPAASVAVPSSPAAGDDAEADLQRSPSSGRPRKARRQPRPCSCPALRSSATRPRTAPPSTPAAACIGRTSRRSSCGQAVGSPSPPMISVATRRSPGNTDAAAAANGRRVSLKVTIGPRAPLRRRQAGLEGRVLRGPAFGVDRQDGTGRQQEGDGHKAEDDRQPGVRPEGIDDQPRRGRPTASRPRR